MAEDAIERTRQRKEMALEAEDFKLASEHERCLTQALRSNRDKELEGIRHRLNIPDAPDSAG